MNRAGIKSDLQTSAGGLIINSKKSILKCLKQLIKGVFIGTHSNYVRIKTKKRK